MSEPKSKQQSEFEKLQKLWYAKLKREGFNDCEQDEFYFKNGGYTQNMYRRHTDPQQVNAKTEYYRLAEHFLFEHKFDSPADKLVWKMHSEGITIKKIVVKVKALLGKSDKSTVHRLIQKLAAIMLEKNNQSDD
jgi:hypothetical protein